MNILKLIPNYMLILWFPAFHYFCLGEKMFSDASVEIRKKSIPFTLLLGNVHEVNLLLGSKYGLDYSLKNWGDVMLYLGN